MCKYNLYTLTWTYRAVIHVEHTPTLTLASEQAPYMIPNAVCVVTYQSYVHVSIHPSSQPLLCWMFEYISLLDDQQRE